MSEISRPGGATISYKVRGSGPPILMIQGVGVAGDGWQPQVDGLADRFTLVTFDNRGLGASTLGSATRVPAYSVELLAEDALAIMDLEGIDQFQVVGHSLGGSISEEVALRAPARVRGLMLFCTFHVGRDGTALTFDLLAMGLRTRIGTRAMRRSAFLELVMPPEALARVDRAELAARLAPLFGHDLGDQPPMPIQEPEKVNALIRERGNLSPF